MKTWHPSPPPQRVRGWEVAWRMLRPHTLTASVTPVLIGTALALISGPWYPLRFLAMLAASLLIQAATNMINEYYDFQRGLDSADSVGIGGTIVHYGVSAATVLRLALALLAGAVLLGIYLALVSSPWVFGLGLAAIAVGYFYSAGPRPISHGPFGELVAGVLMGGLIIVLAFYIQTRQVTVLSVLLSVPSIFLVAAILMANNIRDRDNDRVHGRRTLAIRLGKRRAIIVLGAMMAAAYGWMLGLAVLSVAPWSTALTLASLVSAARAIRRFRRAYLPAEMMPAMQATAATNTQFGLLLTVGLLLSRLLR